MMNKIWFHKLLPRNKNEIQKISKFFFPLDSIKLESSIWGKGISSISISSPRKRVDF